MYKDIVIIVDPSMHLLYDIVYQQQLTIRDPNAGLSVLSTKKPLLI